jgi:hypothetical protein
MSASVVTRVRARSRLIEIPFETLKRQHHFAACPTLRLDPGCSDAVFRAVGLPVKIGGAYHVMMLRCGLDCVLRCRGTPPPASWSRGSRSVILSDIPVVYLSPGPRQPVVEVVESHGVAPIVAAILL